MQLQLLKEDFAICQVKDLFRIDFRQKHLFLAVTEDEISLVCNSTKIPDNVINCDSGWVALKIAGTLDFSLVGILAKISAILAENQISIFAISTFNTDYVLVKKDNLEKTLTVLKNNDYSVLI